MAGAWEFPGGKIATTETPLQGLVRELQEELGISVRYVRHLLRYSHQYPDRLVHLYIWKVLDWRGEVTGEEGQPLQWVAPGDLMQAGLLVADESIALFLQQRVAVNSLGSFVAG
jgi:8-oxo-dGTP diphosphatase